MSEAHYDSETKKLVIGDAAVEAESFGQSMGDYPFDEPPTTEQKSTIYSLPELLTSDDFPVEIGSDPTEQYRAWRMNRESVIILGHWLLKQVKLGGGDSLQKQHIERINILDIGPSVWTIRSIVRGGLAQLRLDIGDRGGYQPKSGMPKWSQAEWQRYAKKVAGNLKGEPRRLTEDDYRAARTKFGGPSEFHVRQFGGVRKLNELIGYPDVTDWDEDDFIEWGARVHMANPDITRPLTQYCLEVLSGKDAGPSPSFVAKRMGSRPRFQELARQRYEELLEEQAERRQQRLDRFTQIASEANTTSEIPAGMTEDEKVVFAAKYDLVLDILGAGRESRALSLAAASAATLYKELIEAKTGLTRGEIELRASLLGLMDDIWPPELGLERLHMTNEEIAAVRAKYATAKQRHEEQRRKSLSENSSEETTGTFDEVRSTCHAAGEKTGEASSSLTEAYDSLEQAYMLLLHYTEGSNSSEVTEAMQLYQEALSRLTEIRQNAQLVREKIEAVAGRL